MKLHLLSLVSIAFVGLLSGCSSSMPELDESSATPAYNTRNASTYPSADDPNMPIAPAFNPPKFYRTSLSTEMPPVQIWLTH